MSELEDEINQISWAAAIKMRIEQEGQIFGLGGYDKGESIEVDLVPESIDGFTMGDDQHISGRLIDPQHAVLHVFESSEIALVGARIGLATYAELMTPAFKVVCKDLKGVVGAGRSMAYYYEDDIDQDSPYKMPNTFHHLPLKYKRLVIGSVALFGEDYSRPS